MTKFQTFLILLILGILFASPTYADDLFQFDEGFDQSALDLYERSLQLAERYPNLIAFEPLGMSTDQRPIYVLRVSENINSHNRYAYTDKMHIMISAGLHARETYNPFVTLRLIEDYAKDYYAEDTLNFVNMKDILSKTVIHVIPLSNPDGFDIVKFGPDAIKDKSLKSFFEKEVRGDYTRLKANVNGVDLNRNFENYTLNRDTMTFKTDEGIKDRYAIVRKNPALDFYGGPYPGSEIETQILQDYYLSYDFRVYLSYHSMGRVIYRGSTHYSQSIAKLTLDYRDLACEITHYKIPFETNQSAWGYESGFVLYNTNKPLITIETTPTVEFPTPSKYYKSEYNRFKLNELPIAFIEKAHQIGYFDYKLYKDGVYVRDFVDLDYAKAIATQIGGEILIYEGPPRYDQALRSDVSNIINSYRSIFKINSFFIK